MRNFLLESLRKSLDLSSIEGQIEYVFDLGERHPSVFMPNDFITAATLKLHEVKFNFDSDRVVFAGNSLGLGLMMLALNAYAIETSTDGQTVRAMVYDARHESYSELLIDVS